MLGKAETGTAVDDLSLNIEGAKNISDMMMQMLLSEQQPSTDRLIYLLEVVEYHLSTADEALGKMLEDKDGKAA